jgi:hypothetical protein
VRPLILGPRTRDDGLGRIGTQLGPFEAANLLSARAGQKYELDDGFVVAQALQPFPNQSQLVGAEAPLSRFGPLPPDVTGGVAG